MEAVKAKQGQIVAKRKDKVKNWYLIQEGTVIQKFDFVEVKLGKNAIIGILESDWFICDYIAGTDVSLIVIPCESADDLKKILAANGRFRSNFLYAAIQQRHQMFGLYADLQMKVRQFHAFAQTLYNDYKNLCGSYRLEEQNFSRMDYFALPQMQHKAQAWEINNSVSLVKNYLREYVHLMEQDDSLCVGAIMEASAQMRRVMQGIGEMVTYLSYNKDILLSETDNDLFYLYFDLAVRAGRRQLNIEPVKKELAFLTGFINKFRFYDAALVKKRVSQYEQYDFGNAQSAQFAKGIDVVNEDCLGHILAFAELKNEELDKVRAQVDAYRSLPDPMATDTHSYQIRRQLSPTFYDLYFRVFMQAVRNEQMLTPIVEMFLNFGFLDVELAGEEHTEQLYNLTGLMKQFHSEHVYTVFAWLKSIYHGVNEPSKNEFDMDYQAYLLDQRKNGELTPEQVKTMSADREEKVRFEIKNMFTSANRITYGKITTFCPILNEYDLINSLDKMAVTVEKLEAALEKIRNVDFSLFYREVNFTGQGAGKDLMVHETLMKEVLPDIILMPNAGTKAMMWQETADKRRDTSARFLFPIFTAADIDDMMLETVARFRWEMCRKIQGVRWNDIREKSLTAEYCDYMQFYRKNHDLSVESKEKLKTALARAKNNYREVFVRDYQNWVKYESSGSFRLNKVAREILVQYCPFASEIRTELRANPAYQNSIPKFEVEQSKKIQRLTALYDKYQKAGGEVTQEMKDNLLYYQL